MTAVDLMTAVLAQGDGAERGATWWETIQSGGVIGYLIIGMSVVALALCVMHLVQIRRAALIPPAQLDRLDELLSQGQVAAALEYCYEPQADSYLTRIMAAGLTRYQKSAFGAFEIKNAIEEAAEDQAARLYRSTDALGVIASTAPLLGLLGTVQGMVGAFGTLSLTAAPDHEQLASNISLALVTTLLGLIVAIPCVALHRYFGNRIDAFTSEAALEIERLALHLESSPGSPQQRLPRPRPVGRASGPAPAPAPAPGSAPAGAPTGKAAPS
jgi:biopolymer transport protein ExbB